MRPGGRGGGVAGQARQARGLLPHLLLPVRPGLRPAICGGGASAPWRQAPRREPRAPHRIVSYRIVSFSFSPAGSPAPCCLSAALIAQFRIGSYRIVSHPRADSVAGRHAMRLVSAADAAGDVDAGERNAVEAAHPVVNIVERSLAAWRAEVDWEVPL